MPGPVLEAPRCCRSGRAEYFLAYPLSPPLGSVGVLGEELRPGCLAVVDLTVDGTQQTEFQLHLLGSCVPFFCLPCRARPSPALATAPLGSLSCAGSTHPGSGPLLPLLALSIPAASRLYLGSPCSAGAGAENKVKGVFGYYLVGWCTFLILNLYF